jgi:hypothetical protein
MVKGRRQDGIILGAKKPQNEWANIDEVDIDFGEILRPEKKAQTIKLRNISKILDDQPPA